MGPLFVIISWAIIAIIVWGVYRLGEMYFTRCAARELEAMNRQSNENHIKTSDR